MFLINNIGKTLLLISETYHMLNDNNVRRRYILDYGPFVTDDWVLGAVF